MSNYAPLAASMLSCNCQSMLPFQNKEYATSENRPETKMLRAIARGELKVVPAASQQKLEDLYDLCQKYVDKWHITEEVAVAFAKHEGVYSLLGEIAKIVGYAQ